MGCPSCGQRYRRAYPQPRVRRSYVKPKKAKMTTPIEVPPTQPIPVARDEDVARDPATGTPIALMKTGDKTDDGKFDVTPKPVTVEDKVDAKDG